MTASDPGYQRRRRAPSAEHVIRRIVKEPVNPLRLVFLTADDVARFLRHAAGRAVANTTLTLPPEQGRSPSSGAGDSNDRRR